MFEKGDLVTYGCKGVCEVKNITTLNLEGIPKDRLYYEMQSMVNAGSRIFSPVGQEEKNAMRAVLTKEEAEELFHISITTKDTISETAGKKQEVGGNANEGTERRYI